MLADVLSTVDEATVQHDYTLVKRDGYDALRRDLTQESALNCRLEIKNTIDLNAPNKPNRHLILISKNVEDAVTGEYHPVTVHAVITRHKDIDDAVVMNLTTELGSLLNQETVITNILSGAS